MSEPIVLIDDGAVRIIRMNCPDKKNALTQPMYAAMTQALGEAQANEKIRCIMLTGTPGRAFCAGSDIGEFQKRAEGGLEFDHHRLSPCPGAQPKAAGRGGRRRCRRYRHHHAAALRLCCRRHGATFATPFTRLGLIPEAASSLLAPLRMGHARAFAMLVMGRPLSAQAAKEAGLINDVVDGADVDAMALTAAREIADLPPGAVATARALMRGNLDDVARRIDTEAMHFKNRLGSDEARAAFAAFFARKK